MRTPLRLAAGAAFLVSVASTPALAENQNRTTIQISTVLASNAGRTFDPRLASLKTELRQLRFRSYNLVSSETRVLHGNGGQAGMELPHGRYLHITTREHTPDHLRLHILLNEDNRPVVNTYVKLEMGSVVMLGGPRDEEGTLVITIGSRPFREPDEAGASKAPSSHAVPEPTPGLRRELDPLPPAAPAPALSASMPGAAPPPQSREGAAR
jgi:hypothetical protein